MYIYCGFPHYHQCDSFFLIFFLYCLLSLITLLSLTVRIQALLFFFNRLVFFKMESYFSDESDFFDESDFSDDGFVQIDEAEYAALEEERRNKLTGDYYFRLYNTSIFSNPDGYRYFAINKSQIDKTNVSRSSGIPIEVMLGYHTVLPAHQKYGRVDPDTIQNFVNGHHADLATSEILKQHLLVLNTTAMVLVHIGSVLDFSKNRMVVLSTCISRTLAILFRSMYPNTSIQYIAKVASKVATEIKTIFHCNGY